MDTLIDIQNVVKHYKKRGTKEIVKAVDDVSFQVKRGEILVLIGSNGAGKTTTIKMICSLIRANSGSITVNGFDSVRERQKALRHISAVLEGNRNIYWTLTVEENLRYFAGNRGLGGREVKVAIDELLGKFRLEPKRSELVNHLSRGMQQKLAIAVAMMANTDVILLDEPTLGLDVETGYEVRSLLKDIAAEGRTIIISTHDMPVVQDLCKRTVIIDKGKVVVDDEVANLLKLFETKAYEITLGTLLKTEQVEELERNFPVVEIAEDQKRFNVTFEQEGDIYKLIDILRSQNTIIEAIDRSNINFEEVFRKITSPESEVDYAVA